MANNLNSMTFQACKMKFLKFITFQVFHVPYDPCNNIIASVLWYIMWRPKKPHWILQGWSHYLEFIVSTWYIFCWSDLLSILRFAACSFAVLCSLNVQVLLRLKSLKALRLTIFHPRGSTDSELWIRVQPSDFPRLVHHCKSNNDENVRCLGREAEELLPEADTFSVETENKWCPRCLYYEFNFCRLWKADKYSSKVKLQTGLSMSKTKCTTIDLFPVFLQWVYNWNEVKARVDNFIQISVLYQSKPPVSAFARILTPDFVSSVYFTKRGYMSRGLCQH